MLMMEPSDDFFLSPLRRIWYRHDRWFDADSEEALKHERLAEISHPYFIPEKVTYFGGPAFFLIFNRLVMRVPLRLKPYLSPALFRIERAYNALPGRRPFAAFAARWRRTHIEVRE